MVATMELDEVAAFVFIDIAIIMVVARLMAALFKRIRQPPVVGEIVAGILLGPTLLGALPGDLPSDLFPGEVRPYLSVLAQLGLIIFMFIVGLELDVKLIRGKERLAGVISLSSIAMPFGLGFLLSAALYGSHKIVRGTVVDFLPFALFIGAAMSITAFPVLARILTERGMYRTQIGALTLACAAVDDIMAWSLLAVVVAVVESTGIWDLPRILLLSVAFVAVMFTVVKPRLELVAERYRQAGRLTPNILAVILIGVLVSSFITAEIGIHSIFGAFVFGVIMPREATADLFREILERLEQVSVLLLLPVFFIVTGLGVDVRGIGLGGASQLVLVMVAACLGKFTGASLGAKLQGLSGRRAATIGVLMNTRGLTELVILNIGLSKGVLDQELFTMLVLMAVFTTIITEPLLRLVYPEKVLARDIAEAERAALGIPDAYRVLVDVENVSDGERLLETALELIADERPSEVVLSRFRPFAVTSIEVGGGVADQLADMTGSLEMMNELAAQAGERGANAVVLSQFSDDLGRDLVTQAATVDADVLLTGRMQGAPDREGGFIRRLLHETPCQVLMLADATRRSLHPEAGRTVVVGVAAGPHSDTAVEVAVRMAHARHSPLRLVDMDETRRTGRRLNSLGEQLRKAGLECTVHHPSNGVSDELARQAGPAGLMIVGIQAAWLEGETLSDELSSFLRAIDASVLLVRAEENHERSELDQLLEKLAQGDRQVGERPAAGAETASAETANTIADAPSRGVGDGSTPWPTNRGEPS